MDSPQIGTQVDMLRTNEAGNTFESAVVVDRLSDPVIGLVLELQFGDAWRVQRVWPSPAIRLRT
jgi:hypothetical protein